jgi:hypothetical protein
MKEILILSSALTNSKPPASKEYVHISQQAYAPITNNVIFQSLNNNSLNLFFITLSSRYFFLVSADVL